MFLGHTLIVTCAPVCSPRQSTSYLHVKADRRGIILLDLRQVRKHPWFSELSFLVVDHHPRGACDGRGARYVGEGHGAACGVALGVPMSHRDHGRRVTDPRPWDAFSLHHMLAP